MSRLTKRHGKYAVQIGAETRRHDEAWLKLAHYEDLEEQGCKMVNIDKIIEQLELNSKLYSLSDRDCEIAIPLNIAIEIVKGGAK